MNETVEKVASFLSDNGIRFEPYGGQREHDGDSWEHFRWAIVFTRTGRWEPLRATFCSGSGNKRKDGSGKPPNAAEVLAGFMTDLRVGEMSFGSFCSDFGYEFDASKARETYFKCCEFATKMRAFFTREEIAQLETLLEDF